MRDEKPATAWQPFTFGGVAAFASAPSSRLLIVQLVVALLAAATVLWFLGQDWFPTIRQAVEQLPAQGAIRSGVLDWRDASPAVLADSRFLALVVDLGHSGRARTPAHVQVEFGRADYQVFSLLGFTRGRYPRNWIIAFNRTELVPWWGAWAPAILALVALAMIVVLLVGWALLAGLYAWPAWLVGFFANRTLSWKGSWRLAGAALMPGAVLLSGGLFLYSVSLLDLVQLAFIAAAHLAVGWGYLLLSPLWAPRNPDAPLPAKNPFAENKPPPDSSA